jgi:hypothetical protein
MSRQEEWLTELAACYFDPRREASLILDHDDPAFPDLTAEERHAAVISQVLQLAELEPEDCWRFIKIACQMSLSAEQLGLLGAGVFEDLMDHHGLEFIDRVEEAARSDQRMRAVVDAVWTNGMDQSVVRGIKAIKAFPRPRASNGS